MIRRWWFLEIPFHGKGSFFIAGRRSFQSFMYDKFTGGSITDQTRWGNAGASLKWSRNRDKRFYSNILASFSNYYSLRNRQNSTTTEGRGGGAGVMFDMNTNENNNLWDYSLKIDNELKLNGTNKLEPGLNFSSYFRSRGFTPRASPIGMQRRIRQR